jgi:Skp family chaperone for outer membrane proteins
MQEHHPAAVRAQVCVALALCAFMASAAAARAQEAAAPVDIPALLREVARSERAQDRARNEYTWTRKVPTREVDKRGAATTLEPAFVSEQTRRADGAWLETCTRFKSTDATKAVFNEVERDYASEVWTPDDSAATRATLK